MAGMTCVGDSCVGRSNRSDGRTDGRRSQMDWRMWHEGGMIVKGSLRRRLAWCLARSSQWGALHD